MDEFIPCPPIHRSIHVYTSPLSSLQHTPALYMNKKMSGIRKCFALIPNRNEHITLNSTHFQNEYSVILG